MPFSSTVTIYSDIGTGAVTDEERGIRVGRSTRDAGPKEILIPIYELHSFKGTVAPGRIEVAASGNPVTYFFYLGELERRMHSVSLTYPDGCRRVISLDACMAILREAVPILEKHWQQCGEDSGLVVQVVFLNGVRNDRTNLASVASDLGRANKPSPD